MGGEPIESKYLLPNQPTVNEPQTPETVKTWDKTIEKKAELLDDAKSHDREQRAGPRIRSSRAGSHEDRRRPDWPLRASEGRHQ